MAFVVNYDGRFVMGSKRSVYGRFTNGAGDSGGDIVTGLNSIDFMKLTHTGSAVVAGDPVVNETFPLTSGDATIVTTTGADGLFFAIGN